MEQKRRGPKSPFGPKDPPNRSYSLTALAKAIVTSAAQRAGTTESNVIELLIRKDGGTVTADDFADLGDQAATQ